MPNKALLVAAAFWMVFGLACATQHEVAVKPVEVKPIHITIDVNIKVDKALDDFFEDIDSVGAETAPAEDAKQTDAQ
jgi:hypothetical protein